jgi:tRNA (guanine-N7-)-methyltransferase
MPKNKRLKYERVKRLPNVTFSMIGKSPSPGSYPWYDERYQGMQRVLELGCGKGEYSLAIAAANSRKLCVGIDRKSHRMCVGAEKAIARGLDNVHFLRARIERIGEFFIEQSIHAIWLTFPDPHPKNRAIKSRLTAASFLDAYANLLIPGGIVYMKTDSNLLYDYTRESVRRWGGHEIAGSDTIHGIDWSAHGARETVSAFEQAARSRGATIQFVAFKLS